ncbi:MAG: hypothetical protein JXR14_08520 [Paracoccaceae bacterium]
MISATHRLKQTQTPPSGRSNAQKRLFKKMHYLRYFFDYGNNNCTIRTFDPISTMISLAGGKSRTWAVRHCETGALAHG